MDKRLDVLATAITSGMTVGDLEQLDLCYAPPFSPAKDSVILAGFAGSNTHRGVMPAMTPEDLLDRLAGESPPVVLDVRTSGEWDAGHLEGAIHVPLDQLRRRLSDVPPSDAVAVYCGSGYRSYLAQRILMNSGRSGVYNVLGGMGLMDQVRSARKLGGS